MSKPRLTTSSANALERLRLVLLVPAVISAVLMLPDIARAHGSLGLRAAGAVASLALAALWAWGYRRRGFPLVVGPPETAALALALLASGGVPPLPLFGLVFRALYDGGARSIVRLASWLVVIWAVALEQRAFVFGDQFGKGAGLALAALLLHQLRRTFDRLDQTESRLRAVVEQSTDIVTVLEPDLTIRSDDAPGFVAGASFLDLIHPGDVAAVERLVADAGSRLVHMRDGREVELVVGNRLQDQHIRGFLVTIRDVTERRRLERERNALDRLRERVDAQRQRQELEARLQRSQRLESVGQLAGGVAHDFNNLLAAILNYTTMVREDLPGDHLAQADLGEVEEAARRGARLVERLLLFSRGQLTRPEVLDPNAVIASLDGLLRGSIGSHVKLQYELDAAPGTIAADVTNVEQVLVNLVVNARDALVPAGGTVTVGTSAVELSADEAVDQDAAPGPYVCLSVSDDGCGMDAETTGRALEPFFSTKAPGTGTGLGLATVAGIVAHAGGWVAIDSAPGAGTTVRVHLPAVGALSAATA